MMNQIIFLLKMTPNLTIIKIKEFVATKMNLKKKNNKINQTHKMIVIILKKRELGIKLQNQILSIIINIKINANRH